MNRRQTGARYRDRERFRNAFDERSISSRSTPTTGLRAHVPSSTPMSNASSRSSERRARGIIDIVEDEDDGSNRTIDENGEIVHRDTSTTGNRSRISSSRTPIRSLPTRHSFYTSSSTPRTPHARHRDTQRGTDLASRLHEAEKRVDAEKRLRRLAESEARDLRASLYAPMAHQERKRKRRSNGEDDDLDDFLLQCAIQGSRDDDDVEDRILRYVLEESRQDESRKSTHGAIRGPGPARPRRMCDPVSSMRRAASATPLRVVDQSCWSFPSAFAADFWGHHACRSRRSEKSADHPSPNLIYRSSDEPEITILSVPRIKAFLDSGLQRPYRINNLQRLADWWDEDSLVDYGVKQKWLLAYSVSEWWNALKHDSRSSINQRLHMDVVAFIEKTWASKSKDEKRAMLRAQDAHPGLCIKGQVYDMQ